LAKAFDGHHARRAENLQDQVKTTGLPGIARNGMHWWHFLLKAMQPFRNRSPGLTDFPGGVVKEDKITRAG
jgi:hypothetical protein